MGSPDVLISTAGVTDLSDRRRMDAGFRGFLLPLHSRDHSARLGALLAADRVQLADRYLDGFADSSGVAGRPIFLPLWRASVRV